MDSSNVQTQISSLSTQTSPMFLPTIPAGQVMMSDRWRNTPVATDLSRTDNVIYSSDLGEIDFHLSQACSVLFISAAALIEGHAYKRRIVKFKKASIERATIIAEKTSVTCKQFIPLQKLAIMELGLRVIPVNSPAELPQLLSYMVKAESQIQKNQFKLKPPPTLSPREQVLVTLTTIPQVKDKRAELLLNHLGSLHKIALASLQELTTIVGPAVAQNVWDFFNKPN